MNKRKNNEEVIRFFIRFLKENGAYKQYIQYMIVYIDQRKKISANIFRVLDSCRLTTRYIIDYFNWAATDEGKKYWVGIHLKWLYMCQKNPELLKLSLDTQQDLPAVIEEWSDAYKTTRAI